MKKILSTVGIILAVLIGTYFSTYAVLNRQNYEGPKVGGSFGESFNSTTTDSTWSVANSKAVKSTAGVLHTFNITNATLGTAITLYDATSTTDLQKKTISTYGAGTPGGSHLLDVAFNRGLVVEATSANVASSTITWK